MLLLAHLTLLNQLTRLLLILSQAENSDNPIKSHKAVDAFLNGLAIIPIFGCIKRYAKEKVRLKKMGKPSSS